MGCVYLDSVSTNKTLESDVVNNAGTKGELATNTSAKIILKDNLKFKDKNESNFLPLK